MIECVTIFLSRPIRFTKTSSLFIGHICIFVNYDAIIADGATLVFHQIYFKQLVFCLYQRLLNPNCSIECFIKLGFVLLKTKRMSNYHYFDICLEMFSFSLNFFDMQNQRRLVRFLCSTVNDSQLII